jgi:hypothetical protein
MISRKTLKSNKLSLVSKYLNTKNIKLSKKNKSHKEKFISRNIFFKYDYPYYKFNISKNDLFKDFNKLRKYKTEYLNYNPTKNYLNKFNNRLIIFKENYEKNKNLYKITDYFSEECRLKCINNLKSKQSPMDYFQNNKENIYQILSNDGVLDITYSELSEFLYQNTPQCTNFNTTVMISLLNLLKPQRVLDPSAGWGDRLIGAIAYNKCEYHGVDPSNCMQPIYREIINTLVPRIEHSRYIVHQNGFENIKVNESYYDLVFTSPPFFDFEIYEKSDSQTQSIEKFNTLESWVTGFLYPLVEKSYKSLIVNGILALYISDYTNTYFVKDMFNYIKNKITGFRYEGDIHFFNSLNNKTNKNKIRIIHLWRKIY